MLLLKPGCEDVRHAAASHGRHAGVHFRWCDRELRRCRIAIYWFLSVPL